MNLVSVFALSFLKLFNNQYFSQLLYLSKKMGQLKKAIINPLGVDALFVTEFYGGAGTAERSADLMDIIARLKKGDRLYIGAILGYHN